MAVWVTTLPPGGSCPTIWELGGGSRWLHGVWGLWQGLVLGLSREWVAAHTPAPGAPPDSGARP